MKNIAKMGMLIALSFVGSLIKIPGTSIAFDSLPGYFAALFMSPIQGGIVGLFGHLLTAYLSGFPLSILVHSILAIEMFVIVFLFGYIKKITNIVVAIIAGTIMNGVLATLSLVPIISMKVATSLIIPLTIVSFANIALASLVYKSINKKNIKGVFIR
ncbi:ECF transporter S component [Tepidibacter formicigenes]|jgi:hypothetical protein|uniref:Alpha-ribazole transporter n=1 Tax=Tepidibacter formicigenes DSM 15518 TaxID=1123349 RepID=A0A1M6RI14_9FIRM|nr:ECF transporter S component [Tepidibacter formicigenes]SHK32073.1 alpha-ribazole transporter [Tepidibacter formicigenes DSM 15518]